MDHKAEIGGGVDHLDVGFDDRDVEAAREQPLARDLTETAEADDEDVAIQAVGLSSPSSEGSAGGMRRSSASAEKASGPSKGSRWH